MARWVAEVDIRPVWKVDGQSWQESRDGVVRLIRASSWMRWTTSDLADILDELECAGTVEEFDAAWNVVYDIADADRVWIRRF